MDANKTCKGCKRELPLGMFYKNNQRHDGLTGKCRDCISVLRKVWDRKYNSTPKARETARRYYYSEKGQKVKIAYREAYELTQEQRDRYRLANRKHEKYRDRTKRYWESDKGKAAKAAKDKRYLRTENGKFAKRKVEIKRKHQISAADCTLTRLEWREIKEAFHNSCAYCKKELARLEMDHVIPLSKGGTHTAKNIVPACRTCNAKKGNR